MADIKCYLISRFTRDYVHMHTCTVYFYIVDIESQLTPAELQRISNEIADIWKEVGMELGLKLHKLNSIELNHPNYNTKASLNMLLHWRDVNLNASRRVLKQAIKKCQTNGGTNIVECYLYYLLLMLSDS